MKISKSSQQSHIMLCINQSVFAGNLLEGVLSAMEANATAKGTRSSGSTKHIA